MRKTSLGTLIAAVAAVLALPAPARAQDARTGPCKPVFDAMLKQMTTSNHVVSTRNGTTSESISVADVIYVKMNGQWRKSPASMKDMIAQQQENMRDVTSASCTPLPDEVVDGQPSAVYQAHYEQKDLGASDAKIWIAKATGLPIRMDASLQAGEKVSVSTRFEYDHITAPVVK